MEKKKTREWEIITRNKDGENESESKIRREKKMYKEKKQVKRWQCRPRRRRWRRKGALK